MHPSHGLGIANAHDHRPPRSQPRHGGQAPHIPASLQAQPHSIWHAPTSPPRTPQLGSPFHSPAPTPARSLHFHAITSPRSMASPAPGDAPNGVETPPNVTQATTLGGPSPPTTQTSGTNDTGPSIPNAALPAEPFTSLKDDGLSSKRPRDARLLHLLLTAQGVQAYQERVPLMIMDFAYRYTSSILSDSVQFSNDGYFKTSSGRGADKEGNITLDHLRLAISARQHFQFQPSLPKEYLASMAADKNKVALPRIEREFGYRLPPEKYTFTGASWGLKEEWEEEGEEEEEGPDKVMKDVNVAVEGGNVEEEDVDQDEFDEVMGGGQQDTAMGDA